MKLLKIFESHTQLSNRLRKPYLIAEAGVNHENSIDNAKRLIDDAAEGGAHAIKFQTYKAETLAVKDSPSYWNTINENITTQYELFKKYDKFWKNEFEELRKYCDQAGVEFLSTPFDMEAATFLSELMDVIKISSSDITNFPFIEYICSFGKPIILSTGASYLWEIHQALELINRHKLPCCLMHCVLNYPTENKNANLGMLLDIKQAFPNAVLGYSDHTIPENMDVLISANLLGATIIEKHFTLDKTIPGNDHYHSMDKSDLKLFWTKLHELYEIVGTFEKKPLDSEEISRKNARRSIVTNKLIKKNQIITGNDLEYKRPGKGISPKHYKELIGKKAVKKIQADEIIQWNMIK
jgi:N-acetylneuraminate synthase